MKVLIVGKGQIGSAIEEIVMRKHEVYTRDIDGMHLDGIEVMHICYPDSDDFVDFTKDYIKQYGPKLTIIHSSIGLGKTDKCGEHVVHCPVRGRHPHLTDQIPAFPIFIGGGTVEDREFASSYLESCNLVPCNAGSAAGTELVKLLSNIHMGLEIAWRQEVERILAKFQVNPLVYERWEESYNEGYRMTNNEQLTRPRLRPDPIGGHCILECTEILSKQHDSKAFDFIKESNDTEKTKRNGHIRAAAIA